MPEGPEVRKYAELIQRELTEIQSFHVLSGRYTHRSLPMVPLGPVEIGWKGKFIYFKLSDASYMWHTLGMTGAWDVYRLAYARVAINASLYYHDARNFGTFKLGMTEKQTSEKLATLGVDLLNGIGSIERLLTSLQQTNRTLAEVLMDQSIFAGVGNYIKAEALYAAGLSPWRRGISEAEAIDLVEAVANVMHASYHGRSGSDCGNSYSLKVYRKTVSPTGQRVKLDQTLDGRTTHWVPQEQH